jgi:hypothetical protein
MTRTIFLAVAIAAMLVADVDAQVCSRCGCKGGPGYRDPDGNCVGWKALNRVCGTPPITKCTPEQVNSEKPIKPNAPAHQRRSSSGSLAMLAALRRARQLAFVAVALQEVSDIVQLRSLLAGSSAIRSAAGSSCSALCKATRVFVYEFAHNVS